MLTIHGKNFGRSADAVEVTFEDETICEVKSVEMTQITCKTHRFSYGVSSPISLTVTINGVADSGLSVEILPSAMEALSLSPSSASPVLKTEITIQLSSFFESIEASDFTATLVMEDDLNTEESEFSERVLHVMSANQDNN